MASENSGKDAGNIFIRPQCLIDTDEEGRFVVEGSVLDQLRRLDGDVIVVAIVGPYRTGKSYLMNRLCGHYTGFPLGSTVQSKTKGIWIWVRVHPHDPEKYLVLLDTEGLGDVEKGDVNHDNAISCLATLLSSTLVYNILGRIDADTLNKLHFVSQLSNHIYSHGNLLQNSMEDEEDEDDDDRQVEEENEHEEEEGEDKEEVDTDALTSSLTFSFPDFVFILRDFDLELKIDGDDVTADEYLERNLTLKRGSTREIRNCNRVRCSLRQAFPRRHCFTFTRPVPGKTKCLEKMRDHELDPEFIDNTGTFIHHILEKSHVKLIDGRRVDGKVLSSLVSLYVAQMNSGTLPSIPDAVSIIRKKGNEDAVAAALTLYNNQMLSQFGRQPFPICQEDFISIHNECLEEALKLFQSEAIFLDEDSSFQETLTNEVFVRLKDYSKQNDFERKKLCQDVLEQLHDEMMRDKIRGDYLKPGGHQAYTEDMCRLEQKYRDIMGSMALESALLRFREEHSSEEMVIAQADAEVVQADQKTREEQLRARAAQLQQEQATQRRLQQEQLLRQRELLNQDVERNLACAAANQQQQMRQRHNEFLEHRLSEQRRLLQEGFAREAAQLNAQIQALQRQ